MIKKYAKFFIITTFILAAFFFSQKAFADATKLVFTSDPQSISSGQISGPITVQLQDDSGTEQKATETIYLNLATSNSGEFSSSKDIWKVFTTLSADFSTSSIYISSNTATRTFYYKGLVSGDHTVTVSARSRSGKTFDSISQIIGIDTNISGGSTSTSDTSTTAQNTASSSDQNSTTTANDSSNTQTITKFVTRYISVHSSPEDLSDYNENSSFDISAGRDRVSYIGTPVKFSAKYKNKITDCSMPTFTWSFGDGTKDTGNNVSHVYKFSGEYNVVLNSSCGLKSSVSRANVKILKPEIIVSYLSSGDLDFKNIGKIEINLGGWKVHGDSGLFEIPDDTIVSAGKDTIISKEYSKVNFGTNGISLFDPSGSLVSSINLSTATTSGQGLSADLTTNLNANTTESKTGNVTFTKDQADNFIREFKMIYALQNSKKIEVGAEALHLNDPKANLIATSTEKSTLVDETTYNASTTNKADSAGGFWSNLLSFPFRGLKAVAGVFYDFK
jgi:hypothetical protein